MKKLGLILIGILYSMNLFGQSCTINASDYEGCVPMPISFNIQGAGSKNIKSINWDFGDGQTSTDEKPVHVYQTRGSFTAKVSVVFTDNSTCNNTYRRNIDIYDNPKANFSLKDNYKRCWYKSEIEFTGTAQKGLDNADVLRYTWDLGDGDTSNRKSFNYAYEKSGKYNVKLEVQDANGCKDTLSKRIGLHIYGKLEVDYVKFQGDSCPVTAVNLINKTDSNGFDINQIRWDFDNGSVVVGNKKDADWDSKWKSAASVYSGSKTFYPNLTLTNVIGCTYKISKYKLENIFFKFDVTASHYQTCYDWGVSGPIITFSQKPIPNYKKIRWTFGDFGSSSNSAVDQFNPAHEFTSPGVYNINLRIEVKRCARDTQYCEMIKISGPKAVINKFPDDFNDTLAGYEFTPNSFPDNFDVCNTDSFIYYTIDTQRIQKVRNVYCNALVKDSTPIQLLENCNGKFSRYEYDLIPTRQFSYKTDKYIRRKQVWRKGDPLPTEKVFTGYTGKHIPENLHDSFLFSNNCSVPHTVNFINNTIKYRLYEAIDNFPAGYPDSCVNPSYPWASDSLNYFWDFGEGNNDTSTTMNPDSFSRYSTERLPIHTFMTEGCYKVLMWAEDPLTKCKSRDSVYITAERPDAGWDEVAYDTISRMDYRKQLKLGKSAFRRGVMLKGLECLYYKQTVDIQELLPSCQMERYWVVFDSAENATETICNGDTIVTYTWIRSDKVPSLQIAHSYETTGWKTVGVVVKNGNCFDTVWYHNYKYIYGANASSSVSKSHYCKGDTIVAQLNDTLQQGIKFVTFTYEYKEDYDDQWQIEYIDTLNYLSYNKNGIERKVTSSLHNSEVKINDDSVYNNLSEKSYFELDKAGLYRVTARVLHRFGCEYTSQSEVGVGHKGSFDTDFKKVCVNDTVQFIDSIFYYKSTLNSSISDEIDTNLYWWDPVYARGGVIPRYAEEVKWDFDNDGIIDHEGPKPYWVYKKPGIYTVNMFTKDSMNCEWIKYSRENYITVASIDAAFSAIDNDTIRFCAPQLFVFKDQSVISSVVDTALDKIQNWYWNWGDGSDALKSKLDKGTTGHLYAHNGAYKVELITYLSTYFKTKGNGCIDTAILNITVEGPLPKFELVGDSVGCVPFKTTVKDYSEKTKVWEWHLGDGRTKPSKGNSLVDFTYTEPGVYCLSLYAGDSIVDFNGDTLYCIDYYPYKKCDIKVRALPKDPIKLLHDSILCLNEFGEFDFANSDESYTAFELAFGDATDTVRTTNKLVKHKYINKDTFNLFYTGSGSRCPDTAYSKVAVIGIKADFELDSNKLDTPTFWFKNLSEEGANFDWLFEDNVLSVGSNDDVRYEFQTPGSKEICLIAYNQIGCSDTLCKWVQIETDVWVPNVLTPNNDGFNDRFKIKIKGHTYYDLIIYNRWGEKVFESTEFDYLWNGKKFNVKEDCLVGTYFYVFKYQLLGEDVKQKHGTVTLLK